MSKFISYEDTKNIFAGKSVVIVGSGKGCLENDGSFIDSHDIVVRVNNYKTRGYESNTGKRTDVFYSFFGGSIKKEPNELKEDGVYLCMMKVPDARIIESEWHKKNNKEAGIDFRKLYTRRAGWWFCDTYAPTHERFMKFFNLLGGHIPTTGFQCILEILSFDVKSVYLTGFDFFTSGTHNVDQKWISKNSDDPIRHMPEIEKEIIREIVSKDKRIILDKTLKRMFA